MGDISNEYHTLTGENFHSLYIDEKTSIVINCGQLVQSEAESDITNMYFHCTRLIFALDRARVSMLKICM